MSVTVLGIDIAKQKFDVALLADEKIKHKTCKNSVEGFEALSIWMEKQGVQKIHACMEATGNYGEDLAIYLHEAGHTVSKDLLKANLFVPRRISLMLESLLVSV
jgi:transposase